MDARSSARFPADTPFREEKGQIPPEQGSFHLYLFLLSPSRPPHVKFLHLGGWRFLEGNTSGRLSGGSHLPGTGELASFPGTGKCCGKLGPS